MLSEAKAHRFRFNRVEILHLLNPIDEDNFLEHIDVQDQVILIASSDEAEDVKYNVPDET